MSTLAAQHSLFTGTSLETVERETNLIDTGIGFIQALLSTAVFPCFFTVCLVQWLREVAPW